MILRACLLALFVLSLTACAGPNGSANGTHRGGSARTDIFRIPFPYSEQ